MFIKHQSERLLSCFVNRKVVTRDATKEILSQNFEMKVVTLFFGFRVSNSHFTEYTYICLVHIY